jgi:hypothetical protein
MAVLIWMKPLQVVEKIFILCILLCILYLRYFGGRQQNNL